MALLWRFGKIFFCESCWQFLAVSRQADQICEILWKIQNSLIWSLLGLQLVRAGLRSTWIYYLDLLSFTDAWEFRIIAAFHRAAIESDAGSIDLFVIGLQFECSRAIDAGKIDEVRWSSMEVLSRPGINHLKCLIYRNYGEESCEPNFSRSERA